MKLETKSGLDARQREKILDAFALPHIIRLYIQTKLLSIIATNTLVNSLENEG